MGNTCRECGAIIDWKMTSSGKWRPYNLDGTIHFPRCRVEAQVLRDRLQKWYRDLETESRGRVAPGFGKE